MRAVLSPSVSCVVPCLAWLSCFSLARGTLPGAVLSPLVTPFQSPASVLCVVPCLERYSRLQSRAWYLAWGGISAFSHVSGTLPGVVLPSSYSCVVPCLGWYSRLQYRAWYLVWSGTLPGAELSLQYRAWYLAWDGNLVFSLTRGTLPGALLTPLVSGLSLAHGTLPGPFILPLSVMRMVHYMRAVLSPSVSCVVPCRARLSCFSLARGTLPGAVLPPLVPPLQSPAFSFVHGTLPEAVLPPQSCVWYLARSGTPAFSLAHGTFPGVVFPPSYVVPCLGCYSRLQSRAWYLVWSGTPAFRLAHDTLSGEEVGRHSKETFNLTLYLEKENLLFMFYFSVFSLVTLYCVANASTIFLHG